MKSRFPLLLLAAALCLAAAPAFAGTVTFNFAGVNNTQLGTSQVFTVGSLSITAYGYNPLSPTLTAYDLYEKGSSSNSAAETGLGLYSNPYSPGDEEINPDQAIVLDVSELISNGITSGNFSLGSLQSREEAEYCLGSTTNPVTTGASCSSAISGGSNSIASPVSIAWGSSSDITFITDPGQADTSGNFLISTLNVTQTTTTPEPAPWLLLGTGLLGLAFMTRRRWSGLQGY